MLFWKEVYPFAGLAVAALQPSMAGYPGLRTCYPSSSVARPETQEVRYPLRRGPDL